MKLAAVFGFNAPTSAEKKPADVVAFEQARRKQQATINEVKETAELLSAFVKGLTAATPPKKRSKAI